MIDLLLKFPSREVAAQIGQALGYSQWDEQAHDWATTQATLELGICVIGEHFVPTGQTTTGPMGEPVPVMAGDGQWWVMVRSLVDMAIPAEIQPFVVVPDPGNPAIPNQRWAD